MSKETITPSDAELVDRFKNGDQIAFDILVERHNNRAFQIAYSVLTSREDAEEVAQDVFVRIYKALPNFRGDSAFTTWMYRIAINLARNKYRWNKTRGSQRTYSIDAPIDGGDDNSKKSFDPADERQDPHGQAVLKELKQNISNEIEKLPPLYRQALILRNVENLSYDSIAKLLNCKLGTIKSRIARAREELRRRLKR